MELNERKLKILKAIVKDYIETAEAVGSRTISKKYDLGVSAATIRNEMADLEELGYLIQPHTSAGRIPSEKGYKLYVDSLMINGELTYEEKALIKECINKNVNDIKDLIHETSKLLSQLTNYTTVAITKNIVSKSVIKHIQLVSLNENNILLIVVTDKGDIKNANLATNDYLDQSKLNIISDNITKKLKGKSIVDLDDNLISFIKYEISEHSSLIDELINVLNLNKNEGMSVSLSGTTNVFSYPEFNDVLKAKSFLHMLEHEEMLESMAKSNGIKKDNVNIIIGSDNNFEMAQDCSIVTATYDIGKDSVGHISFIGPTRMDYAKVYTIVNYMSLIFNKK